MRKMDLPELGTRFGQRTVIGHSDTRLSGIHRAVTCRCDCGSIDLVPVFELRNRRRDRCLSCAKQKYHGTVGERIGKRVVTALVGGTDVEVKCDCGDVQIIKYSRLVNSQRRQCLACRGQQQTDRVRPRREARRAKVMELKAQGMTQSAIANEMGVTPSMVSRIVKGVR